MSKTNKSADNFDDGSLLSSDSDDYRSLNRKVRPDDRFRALSAGTHSKHDKWNFEHVFSPYGRLYYVRHDNLSIQLKNDVIQLPSKHISIIPPQIHFNCLHDGDADHLWVHFSDSAVNESNFREPQHIPCDKLSFQLAELLSTELSGESKPQTRYHLAQALLSQAAEQIPHDDSSIPPKPFSDLLEKIPTQLSEDLSVNTLARKSGYTAEYLCSLFKKFCQETPSKHVRKQRIKEAARRLAYGNETIETIAADLGFANRHHFTRIFSQELKEPPAAFRRRLQST